jgi:thiamine-phosphate pyrophosphorylase
LREKDLGIRDLLAMAYRLRELTDRYSAKLFINDRVDVAVAVEADGVHLGQSSMPAHAAKKASKGNLIVGVSTHSLTEALEAERDGADFITLGPVYQTPSKLKYEKPAGTDSLNKVCKEISIPVFAIGGIKIENLKEAKECGAYGFAVISAILGSDNIKNTAERFMRYFQ